MRAFARLCTAKLVTSAMFWRVSRLAGVHGFKGGLREAISNRRRRFSTAERDRGFRRSVSTKNLVLLRSPLHCRRFQRTDHKYIRILGASAVSSVLHWASPTRQIALQLLRSPTPRSGSNDCADEVGASASRPARSDSSLDCSLGRFLEAKRELVALSAPYTHTHLPERRPTLGQVS